jgi:hypothetical protein
MEAAEVVRHIWRLILGLGEWRLKSEGRAIFERSYIYTFY